MGRPRHFDPRADRIPLSGRQPHPHGVFPDGCENEATAANGPRKIIRIMVFRAASSAILLGVPSEFNGNQGIIVTTEW
jgi:hypothetical protein